MTSDFRPQTDELLLIVDVQNDFCTNGALAVPKGEEVVSAANRLGAIFPHVVLTQDWHPAGHASFASSHQGREPFETIELSYGQQILWPDHCIQGTRGAEFHSGLSIPHAEMIVRKGFHPEIDSYSAFYENDRKTATGLNGYLRDRGFKRLFLCGLATDFCVQYSALDALRDGFEACVIEDACRAIDLEGSLNAAHGQMRDAGVRVSRLSDFGIA